MNGNVDTVIALSGLVTALVALGVSMVAFRRLKEIETAQLRIQVLKGVAEARVEIHRLAEVMFPVEVGRTPQYYDALQQRYNFLETTIRPARAYSEMSSGELQLELLQVEEIRARTLSSLRESERAADAASASGV